MSKYGEKVLVIDETDEMGFVYEVLRIIESENQYLIRNVNNGRLLYVNQALFDIRSRVAVKNIDYLDADNANIVINKDCFFTLNVDLKNG